MPTILRAAALFVVLASVGLASAARQSKPASDTGALSGRIVDAQTGIPIPGATVRLAGLGFLRPTSADDEGAFEFSEIPPGAYRVTATSPGYAAAAYGQRVPTESPRSFQLAPRETRSQIDLPLMPLGRLSGQIVDEAGKPVPGIRVSAVRKARVGDDERRPGGATAGATTDAEGRYLVTGLAPGQYYVMAIQPSPQVSGGRLVPALFQVPARTLYPGTVIPAVAQTVRVDLATEATDITFALQPPRSARIAGTVVDAGGQPVKDGVVLLNPAASELSALTGGLLFSEVGDDGSFLVKGVPPGLYSLDVRSKSAFEAIALRGGGGIADVRMGSPEFASEPLRVDGQDIENLMVRTQPGFTITGKIVAPGLTPSEVQAIELTAFSTAELSQFSRALIGGTARAESDGSFEVRKLFGPLILRVSGLPAGWALKSVKLGAAEFTDEGIDISHDWSDVEVVIGRDSGIVGRVADRRGLPIAGATVMVFSEDPQRRTRAYTRYVKTALSDDNGAFTIAGLPTGRYYGVALPTIIPGELVDPDDLDALVSRATRFPMGEGEKRVLDLRLE